MDLARIYASLGARLIGDQTGERADFVRLFHRSIHGSTPDEKWADLMERSGDKPIVAFARLAARQHDGPDATRIKRIDEARSRYADLPVLRTSCCDNYQILGHEGALCAGTKSDITVSCYARF